MARRFVKLCRWRKIGGSSAGNGRGRYSAWWRPGRFHWGRRQAATRRSLTTGKGRMPDNKFSTNIQPFQGKTPRIHPTAYVHPSAIVIGDVEIQENATVWCHAVIRGDGNRIVIGRGSNIQDQCCLHADPEGVGINHAGPLLIGENVTVGHKAMLHGCTIHDRSLIGIGAIVLNGALIEENVILGAGSLVGEGKRLAAGYLYFGTPARQVRPLTPHELARFDRAANGYTARAIHYKSQEA